MDELQLLFFGLAGGIKGLMMEPTIIDKVFHNKVSLIFPSDLSPGRKTPIGIILIILISISILSNQLSILFLILKLLSNVPVPFERFRIKYFFEHYAFI